MNATRGIFAATSAYVIWGLLPLYWKTLEDLPAYEILCHRMSWSLIFMVILLLAFGRFRILLPLLKDKKTMLVFFTSSMLLGVNWLIYIWSVNNGFIIEASLGYYINPLVTVAFGVFFFGERLRFGQIAALCLAAVGVIYLTIVYGRFPWIALSLAISFAIYGLIHKKTSVASVEGLCLETMIFFLPAVGFLIWLGYNGHGAFLQGNLSESLLMIGAGAVTTLPLLLFSYAAHNIPLSLLGILQYTAPTINLLLGVFLYHEGFPQARMTGFILVWSALVVFMIEGAVYRSRHKRMPLQ